MGNRKKIKKYYFSVEGETEKWYFDWLQELINDTEKAVYNVSFDVKKQKNPLKYAKSLVVTGKTEIYHISDYESDEEIHVKQFTETMDNMKKAMGIGKQITYRFGYSNLTFDLWMILHKDDCNGSVYHRDNYIIPINKAYDEKFVDMKEYKHEDNFKRCLKKLNIQNVVDAVKRADRIMRQNQDRGYTLHKYKGFEYYKENPSLNIWKAVEKILMDCGLM